MSRLLYPQDHDWTCVAACVRTVLAMRNEPVVDEDQVLRMLGPPPYGSLDKAAAFGGYTRLRIDVDVDILLGFAERGFACIVMARPAFENGLAVGLTSAHGELSGGHHAIVIIAVDRDAFLYVDPWFPEVGQPLRVSIGDFVRDWWVSGLLHV